MSLKLWQRFGDDTEGFETVDGLTEHGPRKGRKDFKTRVEATLGSGQR